MVFEYQHEDILKINTKSQLDKNKTRHHVLELQHENIQKINTINTQLDKHRTERDTYAVSRVMLVTFTFQQHIYLFHDCICYLSLEL